jgi:hypothetical protein
MIVDKKESEAKDKATKKKKLVRVGIQCIKCSISARKKKRDMNKKKSILSIATQSKKVPRSVLVKRLQRKHNKRGISANHLRVRGNKNVGVKTFPLKNEHTLKFWKTPGTKIQLQRVKDRKRTLIRKK